MSTESHDTAPDDQAAARSSGTTRRELVTALAKAAIVPAVIAGVAANTHPAHAR